MSWVVSGSNAAYNSNTDWLTLLAIGATYGQGTLALPQDNSFYTSFILSNTSPPRTTVQFGDCNTTYALYWTSSNGTWPGAMPGPGLSLFVNSNLIQTVSGSLLNGLAQNTIELRGKLGDLHVYLNNSNHLQYTNSNWSWGTGGYVSISAYDPVATTKATIIGFQQTPIFSVLDHTEFLGDVLFDGAVYASNLITPQYTSSNQFLAYQTQGSNVFATQCNLKAASNVAYWSSNNSSNLTALSNNVYAKLTPSSNAAFYGSNTSFYSSNAAFYSSNILTPKVTYSSNTAAWTSNSMSNDYASNQLPLYHTLSNWVLQSNYLYPTLATTSNAQFTLSNYTYSNVSLLQGSAWTQSSALYTLCNVAIGKSTAGCALDVLGTVNATTFSGNVPWTIVTGAPALTASNASDGSTTSFSLGGTILSGLISGFTGAAAEYALQIGGQKLFDVLGNFAPDFVTNLVSTLQQKLGTGSFRYLQLGPAGGTMIINGSNDTIWSGNTSSNTGMLMSSNAITACNTPWSLQYSSGSNLVTALTMNSSNLTTYGTLATSQLLLAGSNVQVVFAPSNTLLSVSGVATYASNQLPSYHTVTAFQLYSNATNGPLQFGSNTASYSSNALSNYHTLSAFGTYSNWASSNISNTSNNTSFAGGIFSPSYYCDVARQTWASSPWALSNPVVMYGVSETYGGHVALSAWSEVDVVTAGSIVFYPGVNLTSNAVPTATMTATGLGIGMSPTLALDVNGEVGISSAHGIEFGKGVSGKETNAGKCGYQRFTSDSLDIVGAGTTNGSRLVHIFDKLGIACSPSYTLDVNGQINCTTGLRLPAYVGYLVDDYWAANDRYGLAMTSSVTRVYASSSYSGSAISLGQATGTNTFSDQLYINHTGQVGINNASPGYQLDVSGNGRFTGQFQSDTLLYVNNGYLNTPQWGTFGGSGDRLVIWPGGGSSHPYSLGMNGSTLWYSVPATCLHQWYVGGAVAATLWSNYFAIPSPIQARPTLEIASPGNGSISWAMNVEPSFNNFVTYSCPTAGTLTGATKVMEITRTGNRLMFWGNGMYIPYGTSITETYGYLNTGGQVGTGTATTNYSIQALTRICASEFNAVSDRRVKEEIKPFDDELCAKLVGDVSQKHFKMKKDGRYKIGFIAQEVEEVIPNAVVVAPHDTIEDFLTLDHSQMTAVLWGAVRHLQAEVRELKNNTCA